MSDPDRFFFGDAPVVHTFKETPLTRAVCLPRRMQGNPIIATQQIMSLY
jgi:hypothetical protein